MRTSTRRRAPRRRRRSSGVVTLALPTALALAATLAWAAPCLGAARGLADGAVPDLPSATAGGVAAPLHAMTPTTLSLGLDPAVVDYDGAATLSGRLDADGLPVAGAAVEVSSSTDGATWSEPTAVTTDGDGRFSLQVAPSPQGRTTFRVAFAGDALYQPAEAQIVLEVRARLQPPLVPRTVGRDSRFATSGLLTPPHAAADAPVTIECYRLVSGTWLLRRTIAASVTTTASGSVFRASIELPTAGTWRLRAAHQDAAHALSRSPWSARCTVTRGPDAPVWDRDGVTTVPERMASRLNARQLVVVTGAHLGSRDGRLRVFRYRDGDWLRILSVPARFGEHGLTDGLTRRAGTRTTPTGIWRLPGFAFGTHRHGPSGLRLAWRHISPRSWWSAERNATYNTWVETGRHVDGEHLADYPGPYEFAISSGYNARPNPCVYGRGTAIFLHVIHPGYSGGCVLMARTDVVRLLRRLDPAARPACAIGTTRAGRTSTSIWSY